MSKKRICLRFTGCLAVLLMVSPLFLVPSWAEEMPAKWIFEKSAGGTSSPVIGSDGTIYVGSEDMNLYAINPDGTEKWAFQTYGRIFSSPAVGSDGTIYVGAGQMLYAINPDEKEAEWTAQTEGDIYASPALGSDGVIYVGSNDGHLYAIDPENGDKKWIFPRNDLMPPAPIHSSPAIGADGTIYVGTTDCCLYAINPDGTEKWVFKTEIRKEEYEDAEFEICLGPITSSPAIGSDGTIYVGSFDGNLYAVSPDGNKKWAFKTRDRVTSSPAIGADGTIYIGSLDGNLYAIIPGSDKGTQKWVFSAENGEGIDVSSPAVGSDGVIYVGALEKNIDTPNPKGTFYAVNPDGTRKWVFKEGDGMYSSPAIGADNTIYIESFGGDIYAIQGSGHGEHSPWPMFRHDAGHTGRVSGELPLQPQGTQVTADLWIGAIIQTEEKGPVEAVWKERGRGDTEGGHSVIWGYFHASPDDVDWGSEQNPDLFVKIWFDASARVDVNFFHVSVPDIHVFSEYNGVYGKTGTTTLDTRYVRQWYLDGQSHKDENLEDGIAAAEHPPASNPSGYSTIHDLRTGAVINTEEKGLIDAQWYEGGNEVTAGGHEVLWGHFYADPEDVPWGNEQNPDLFVKIWFDASGRVDVNFFHVSVPEIEVFSDMPDGGEYDQKGTAVMADRYVRHEYWR